MSSISGYKSATGKGSKGVKRNKEGHGVNGSNGSKRGKGGNGRGGHMAKRRASACSFNINPFTSTLLLLLLSLLCFSHHFTLGVKASGMPIKHPAMPQVVASESRSGDASRHFRDVLGQSEVGSGGRALGEARVSLEEEAEEVKAEVEEEVKAEEEEEVKAEVEVEVEVGSAGRALRDERVSMEEEVKVEVEVEGGRALRDERVSMEEEVEVEDPLEDYGEELYALNGEDLSALGDKAHYSGVGDGGQPALSSSGLSSSSGPQLLQCPQALEAYQAGEELSGQLPESQKVQDLPGGSARKWPPVNVTTLGGMSDFGWIETTGEGVSSAVVNKRTCTLVSARTRGGQPFDQGTRQRAFFLAVFRSGSIIIAGSVTYLPERSMHLMCAALPTVGVYYFELKIGFTNAFDQVNCLDPSNNNGFALYRPVLSTWVKVTGQVGRGKYDLQAYRATLPLCATGFLDGKPFEGYWDGNTWYPFSCRLTRLSPSNMLLCLDGKRVMMMGDSQMRLIYGVMHYYLNSTSRDAFLERFDALPHSLGDLLRTLNISPNATANLTGPPLDSTTGMAQLRNFSAFGGTTFFHGGVYQGFAVRTVNTQVPLSAGISIPVSFNLTFSSSYQIEGPLFNEWKLTGELSGGAKVTDGGAPIDLFLVANQIHDVKNYNSPNDYTGALKGSFLPQVAPLLKNREGFTLLGGLSPYDARKGGDIYVGNNARVVAFQAATSNVMRNQGYTNYLPLHLITGPRPDLVLDATHYTWPVSLAVLDLWLGSTCPVAEDAS